MEFRIEKINTGKEAIFAEELSNFMVRIEKQKSGMWHCYLYTYEPVIGKITEEPWVNMYNRFVEVGSKAKALLWAGEMLTRKMML